MADEKTSNAQGEPRPESAAGILALLGAAALSGGVVLLVLRQRLWWPVYALWGAGAAALGAAAALRPRAVLAALRGRGVRYGSNTALLVILVLGIAALVNYLAVRHHKRFDLTRTRAHSLSPQTRKILRGLKQPVKITAFYSPNRDPRGYQEMRDLLDEYRYASRQVQTSLVDWEAKPSLAMQYGIQSNAATVVEAGGKREELFSPTEQELTSAILKLTQQKKKKIYFVQGHGEHAPDNYQAEGYSTVKEALTALNYEVEKLTLPGKTEIPADCDVLVIGGPRTDFGSGEIQAVKTYLANAGKALIMVDPEGQGASLAQVLEPWGVEPLPDVVVEPNLNFLGDASSVTAVDFAYHDITRPFTRGRAFVAVFFLVRGFELNQEAAGTANAQDLLRTSPDSWLEDRFRGTIRRDGDERRGPLTIAAVVSGAGSYPPGAESEEPRTRLVVFGDSDFAVNALIANGVNKDLVVNSIGWLAQEEQLIAIQPKQPESSPVLLSEAQARWVLLLCLFLMPLGAVVVGAVVWWRRR